MCLLDYSLQLALATWTVSFSSSAYTGGLEHTMRDLQVSYNVATLGISLYVLGFALGSVLVLVLSSPDSDLS
jgi:predicted MFS family arabinose efflux permease